MLVELGTDACLISQEVARQLDLGRVPLPLPVPPWALDGHCRGTITHQTQPVSMLLSGNHNESLQFNVLNKPDLPVVVGLYWLQHNNPHIKTPAIFQALLTDVLWDMINRSPPFLPLTCPSFSGTLTPKQCKLHFHSSPLWPQQHKKKKKTLTIWNNLVSEQVMFLFCTSCHCLV